MATDTKIEWCDSTLNLQMGCDGCELWNEKAGVRLCYAGNLSGRYAGLKGWPDSFTQPKLFAERLAPALRWHDLTGEDRPEKPWLNGYPRLIFLNDLGDTFTESLPVDWMAPYVDPMAESPHIYIVLTKRPRRMFQFWTKWCIETENVIPENFWLLTSVTGPENIGRIRELLKLRALGASVLGVSYEPAWGAVDFRPFLPVDETHFCGQDCRCTSSLDWIIGGGESGAGAQPSHPQWFRNTRDVCQAVGAAFFFKQWGEYSPLSRTDGIHELPFGDYSVTSRFGFLKQGKKKSGALLDGREWRQMPTLHSPGSLISGPSTETSSSTTKKLSGTALKESL